MSRFLRVQCDCGAESVVFGDSKSVVNCSKCGNAIVYPTGGRARVEAKIVEVIG